MVPCRLESEAVPPSRNIPTIVFGLGGGTVKARIGQTVLAGLDQLSSCQKHWSFSAPCRCATGQLDRASADPIFVAGLACGIG